jgi:putative hydrolase of the HAD superfamily
MIDAIVVDFGGVVAHFHPERRLRALAMETGLSERQLDAAIFGSGLDVRAELGEYEPETLADILMDVTERRIAHDVLVRAWSRAFEPVDAVLQEVAATSATTVLLTNNGPMLDACLAGPLSRVATAFDFVVCSWHIGFRKPDPRVFDYVSTRFGDAPQRLVLLDDTIANVEAARSYGWRAEHVTNERDAVAVLKGISRSR